MTERSTIRIFCLALAGALVAGTVMVFSLAQRAEAAVFMREIIGMDDRFWQPHLMLALAVRDLVVHYADGDPSELAAVSVRWASPVFPGDQLLLEVWETHPARMSFRTLGPSAKAVLVQGTGAREQPVGSARWMRGRARAMLLLPRRRARG